MSDIGTSMSADNLSSAAVGTKPGAILAAERVAQGLSIEQVADQLKLANRQVLALEKDDYAALPGATITRGFVRAYAKYLKLDAAPLVAMIPVENGIDGGAMPIRREMAKPFAETTMPSSRGRNMTPFWLAGSGLLLCLIAALAWLNLSGARLGGSATNAASAGATASAGSAPVASLPAVPTGSDSSPVPTVVSGAVSAPVTGSVTGSVAGDSAAAPATVVGSTPAPGANPGLNPNPAAVNAAQHNSTLTSSSPLPSAPPAAAVSTLPGVAANPAQAAPAAGNNTLVLKLRQDSWVEVKRQNGSVILSRLMKAGSTETIDMKDPVLLVVGNVSGVEANLRGNALNLKTGPGNTARLSLK